MAGPWEQAMDYWQQRIVTGRDGEKHTAVRICKTGTDDARRYEWDPAWAGRWTAVAWEPGIENTLWIKDLPDEAAAKAHCDAWLADPAGGGRWYRTA